MRILIAENCPRWVERLEMALSGNLHEWEPTIDTVPTAASASVQIREGIDVAIVDLSLLDPPVDGESEYSGLRILREADQTGTYVVVVSEYIGNAWEELSDFSCVVDLIHKSQLFDGESIEEFASGPGNRQFIQAVVKAGSLASCNKATEFLDGASQSRLQALISQYRTSGR